ncbi:3-alpha-(or 20-beta)-hydroxysteroid dehydrogenase [Kaistia sp. 32K]|uniref:SDR family NAD(P)-dependent oxidoreductase n=1 Tax=Kaistia sp. 32K TaxID=2795690 RepID=UPI001914E2CD|nr:glucose 1-dehydrogenase [Kaistia sp. 32K]BCP53842.1 3-alpha-(or 20-beta)-hydroxysteroid dehydrogenase [Kaistia sp. 32K]
MTGRLEGKVAIVTGGSRGQGASHVRAFVREGAKVAFTDIRVELGEELAKELGDDVLFIQQDVSKPEDWDRVVAETEAAFGPINILVNNAGIVLLKEIEDTSYEEYLKIVAVNQHSVFLGMKAVVPSMRRAGSGSIVNVSSAAVNRGVKGNIAYTAAKAAIGGMSRVAALDLAEYNIRVNTVLPGIILTPLVDEPDPERVAAINARIPVKRLASVEEVSNLIVYLASDESSYSTASEFTVDGGLTA